MAKLIQTKPCIGCGKSSTLTMTDEQYELMESPNRPMMQTIFPDWPPSAVEMLISGTHPDCWDAMFAGMDED